MPEEGDNPNYALAAFLERLEAAQSGLSSHPILGKTTAVPTIIEVDTRSQNVTPSWTRVLVDFRTASESPRSLCAFVERLAAGSKHSIETALANMPVEDSPETIVGFYTAPESDAVTTVRHLLAQGMGREPALISYRFATDGRHLTGAGFPILGYAPGQEDQAHIIGESIAIDQIDESLRGHMTLLKHF
jgi:acetylornithine deacetylase/succinyl-diaminopimelate desuccinylase-like protein